MSKVEISIVVPVYRSEDCLEELQKQISTVLAQVPYELILVNDKSPDRSWEKIVELAEKSKSIKGASLKKNAGQDNAIMAGLGLANGNYVVVMDDDLQHSPSDILKLYNKCREGFDICYGLFTEKKQSLWKNLGSKLNEHVAEFFLKKPRGLYLSPFKIMSASLVQEVVQYKGPYPYLDGIVLSLTSNITQLELQHHPRYGGKGNYNLMKSVSVFLKHVTGFSLYPLRLATLIGVLAAALSFLLGAYFLVEYLTMEVHVEGWTSLAVLVVFFNGLILMCLGMIGEYIGRVYLTLTSKRQYVIDKMVTSDQLSEPEVASRSEVHERT
jgi:polyisoprenyl-phosphate glycosyltransferase